MFLLKLRDNFEDTMIISFILSIITLLGLLISIPFIPTEVIIYYTAVPAATALLGAISGVAVWILNLIVGKRQ